MRHIILLVIVFVLGFSLGYAGNAFSLFRNMAHPVDSSSKIPLSNTPSENPTSLRNGSTSVTSSSAISNPVTVPPNRLTDGQKALLQKMGIDPNKFVVTPSMMKCAEDALGSARVSEIIGGGTPSPLETLRLSPCLGK